EDRAAEADRRAQEQEAEYVAAALALFGLEWAAIQALVARLVAAHPGTIPQIVLANAERELETAYAAGGTWAEAWAARVEPLITTSVDEAGEELGATLGFDFALENPRVQAVIADRAGALVANVTATTRERIRAAIAEGRAQGWGLAQVAARIEETTFGDIADARARTIARTETIGALNAGEHAAAVASGIVRSKEWLNQGDDRVRDSHEDQPLGVGGERVPLEAAFSNGLLHPGEAGGAPEEVINCRCTLLYHTEDVP
ncbi:MAG TPA: phage minor head protein, partial [Candidatus Limnocylindria bacterium]|nr:phage minor head protein [Candidatus Limnocylindria bacterium]